MSRPRFWLYLAGPFVLGSLIASQDAWMNAVFWVLFFFFLVIANVLLYGINDYYDTDTDLYSEKKQEKEFIFDNESWVFVSWASALLIGLVLAWILPGYSGLFLGGFLVLAVLYSTPPVRLKARPVLDSLSNVLYVLPALVGYTLFSGVLPAWWAIGAGWAWASAMHLFSAVPDIAADNRANIKTTAVLLGVDNSLLVCALWWLIAVLFASFSGWYVVGLGLVYCVIALLYVGKNRKEVEQVYWYFPYINAAAGFLLFLQIVL